MSYQVHTAGIFLTELEEASEWLYSHNEQQSIEFAEKKKAQLQTEVIALKNRLSEKPYGLGTEVIAKIPTYRKLSIYDGRYQAEWTIHEAMQQVSLLRLKDLKYPAKMRYKEFTVEEN